MTRFIFRGTTVGWPGNPGCREAGFTCTTCDPLVATLFAPEATRYGKAVVFIADFEKLRLLVGESNAFAEIEREIVVRVAPLDFSERFAMVAIGAQTSLEVLRTLGFELPVLVGDKEVLRDLLESTPRLDEDQIVEFVRRVRGI